MTLTIACMVLISSVAALVVVFWPRGVVSETAKQAAALMEECPEGWEFRSDEGGDLVVYRETKFAIGIGVKKYFWDGPGWELDKADEKVFENAVMGLMAAQLRMARELIQDDGTVSMEEGEVS